MLEAKPSQAKPSQAKPSQAKPSQAKPSQARDLNNPIFKMVSARSWKRPGILLLIGVCSLLPGCTWLRPTLPELQPLACTCRLSELKENLEAQATGYRKQINELEGREWSFGETTLLGGAVGAVGAVAHSTPAVVVGALTVGSTSLFNSFYGVEKQNDAYVKAYAATGCLITILDATNKPGLLHLVSSVDNPDQTAEAYVTQELCTAREKIDRTLFSRLRKRSVSTNPNFELFQSYFKNSLASGRAPLTNNQPNNLTTAQKVEKELLQAAIGRLKSDIGMCLSAN